MTEEMQRALARYEAARGRYRVAVLASFQAKGRGDAIRTGLRDQLGLRATAIEPFACGTPFAILAASSV